MMHYITAYRIYCLDAYTAYKKKKLNEKEEIIKIR